MHGWVGGGHGHILPNGKMACMGVGPHASRARLVACTCWQVGARQGTSVAAGTGEAGFRPARVKRPGNRGLAQLCHASKSGKELRYWRRVMLGV